MAEDEVVDHYGSSYGHFASRLFAEIRLEAFTEDIGQNGWLTVEEQDLFLSWLDLSRRSRLLDVACGSGGPTLRVAGLSGACVHGIDLHPEAIERARAQAEAAGLGARAAFDQADASKELPFADATFDGLICIDAVNHLPDRRRVFAEWGRVLRSGGHLVFTDPITVTGPLTNEEIRIRSSIGFFLFVPDGTNEPLLEEAGLEVLAVEDRTQNMARMARRWHAARGARARHLRSIEGDETFEGQQEFFAVAAMLAEEGRLSRLAFHACRR